MLGAIHTGGMTGGQRTNARWVAVALAGTLLACAVVVYALIRLTSPGTPGDGAAGTGGVTQLASTPSGTDGDANSSGTHTVSDTTGETGAPSGTSPSTEATPQTTSPSGTFLASPSVPPTTTSRLPSSAVLLPASWSGTAKVTVTVRGECASMSPSVYRDIPADLALDLVQNEANSAEVALPDGASGDDVTLTLGINPNGVPALAVYSSQIDASGVLRRFWRLELTPSVERTEIRGTLIDQSGDGSSPNTMIDAETSLQPCESASTFFPRLLAQGATIDGWVSSEQAMMTLHAATTDGKRQIDVEFEAERTQ